MASRRSREVWAPAKPAPADGVKAEAKSKSKTTAVPKNYKATIADLRSLGDVVAKSKIRVPDAVLAVARRAIKLRKDTTLFFMGKGDRKSNKKHAYFVRVLEEICESLEWRSEPQQAKKDTSDPSASKVFSRAASAGDTDAQSWQNKFASLTVEDPEDVEIPDPENAGSKSLCRLELVEQDEADSDDPGEVSLDHLYFNLCCLFRDLNTTRDFVSSTWVEYRDNKIDLMTASVVTDSALQFARDMIQDVVNAWPQAIDDDDFIIQQFTYVVTSVARGVNTTPSKELGLPYSVHMADVAEWCYIPTFCLLQAFIPVMQKSPIPVFKKGCFGVYDPKADRSKMTPGERFKEDQIVLLETLSEFCFMSAFQNFEKRAVPGEITQGFIEFARTEKSTLWLCFAAQVFLDVHHAIRSSRIGALASKTPPMPDLWPKEGDMNLIASIQNCVHILIKKDPLIEWWDLAEKSFNRPEEAHQDHFYFSQNPILCGLLMFHLDLRLQTLMKGLVNLLCDVQYVQ